MAAWAPIHPNSNLIPVLLFTYTIIVFRSSILLPCLDCLDQAPFVELVMIYYYVFCKIFIASFVLFLLA